jgi:hypothetical protein
MSKRSILYSFFLIVVSLWLGWSVLVDIAIIPTVFKVVTEFFIAGELGMAVFYKLNNLELVAATSLVVICIFQMKKVRSTFPFLIMSLIGLSLVLFYFSYLTPKIMMLTDHWRQANLLGVESIAGIRDIQQEHQFYHRMYITLDSIKILLLSSMLALGIYQQEKWA